MTPFADRKELVLPWPFRALSPNARVHWRVKSAAARAAKHDAYMLAKAADWHRIEWPAEGRLHVWIDGYRPSRRHHDHDNLLASLKAALDGIADAMGIDDRRFVPHPYIKDEVRKGGEVRIRITGSPAVEQEETQPEAA